MCPLEKGEKGHTIQSCNIFGEMACVEVSLPIRVCHRRTPDTPACIANDDYTPSGTFTMRTWRNMYAMPRLFRSTKHKHTENKSKVASISLLCCSLCNRLSRLGKKGKRGKGVSRRSDISGRKGGGQKNRPILKLNSRRVSHHVDLAKQAKVRLEGKFDFEHVLNFRRGRRGGLFVCGERKSEGKGLRRRDINFGCFWWWWWADGSSSRFPDILAAAAAERKGSVAAMEAFSFSSNAPSPPPSLLLYTAERN